MPKCRPSFQQLIDQLENLWAGLSPAPSKEPQLYVNLEGEDLDGGAEQVARAGASSGPAAGVSWGVPWQCAGMEEDEKDWLMVSSGAARAIGGDYRYIIGPHCGLDDEGRPSSDGLSEDIRDEDEDAVINV